MELQKLSKLLEIIMEKYKLSRFLPQNEILDHIKLLDENQDGISSFLFHNAEDYGVYLVTLLEEIAKKKNTSFWYIQLGVLCSFDLSYVDGARLSSLYYYIKAHELDPKDATILNALLYLGEPPEVVLTIDQKKYYAAKLLALEPENEKALAIINS